MINGFGSDWLKEFNILLEKRFSKKTFKMYVDCKKNYGLFINLEGRLQNAYKASYPPGDAREDWIIFKEIATILKKPIGFDNVKELRENIKRCIQSKINIKKNEIISEQDFFNEIISIKPIDYYHTNVIARASKTMSDCKQISKKLLFTGIEKAS